MMLRKLMSKIGVGSAQVDLVLQEQTCALGERITGEFRITGGTVEQRIEQLDCELVVEVKSSRNVHKQVVATIPIVDHFTIGAGEYKVIPFSYELPLTLLVSSSSVSYAFVSRLDIAGAVASKDHDWLRIVAPKRVQQLLRGLQSLGFQEKTHSRAYNGEVQTFEYEATGKFQTLIEDVTLIIEATADGVRVVTDVTAKSHMLNNDRDYEAILTMTNDHFAQQEEAVKWNQFLTTIVASPQGLSVKSNSESLAVREQAIGSYVRTLLTNTWRDEQENATT